MKSLAEGYSKEPKPLAEYAFMMTMFCAGGAAFFWSMRCCGKRLPEKYPLDDVLLIGVATHKLSRLITREKVASAVRAPFTEFEESAGSAEVEENPRGSGLRKAIGELITCPYCLGVWIAAALTSLMAVQPRFGRFVSALFSAVTVSDFLQQLYRKARE